MSPRGTDNRNFNTTSPLDSRGPQETLRKWTRGFSAFRPLFVPPRRRRPCLGVMPVPAVRPGLGAFFVFPMSSKRTHVVVWPTAECAPTQNDERTKRKTTQPRKKKTLRPPAPVTRQVGIQGPQGRYGRPGGAVHARVAELPGAAARSKRPGAVVFRRRNRKEYPRRPGFAVCLPHFWFPASTPHPCFARRPGLVYPWGRTAARPPLSNPGCPPPKILFLAVYPRSKRFIPPPSPGAGER